MVHLGVNIDHVATLRQARRGDEPDPAWAAVEAQLAGAQCLTVHLREDRRHIQDHDVLRVQKICQVKYNLEMAATEAMVRFALEIKPHMATLVPEGRAEVTTEGGLDVAGQLKSLTKTVASLQKAGVACSAFIDPDPKQIDAAAEAGFSFCEIHTGPYARSFSHALGNLKDPALQKQLKLVAEAGVRIQKRGMTFNAGHALNYQNVREIAALEGLCELHIGHSIISRAVFVGLSKAVSEMLGLLNPETR